MIRKFAVCTTFNEQGYKKYGKRMIQSFLQNWPTEVDLIVYAENCHVDERATNLQVFDSHLSIPELAKFKETWKNVPKANGDISSIPHLAGRKDAHKPFRWDAVRFSNKVYAVWKSSKITSVESLIWMDADMFCHSQMTIEKLNQLCPVEKDLAFLGREKKFTECGLYYLNLKSQRTLDFIEKFQQFYENAEQGIFTLTEWHDSFVFDAVRKLIPLNELNWSHGLIHGEGHPLINCEWGGYLDHLKGSRKDVGRSHKKDLLIKRNESYWNSL
jgi:hypothetical protein